MWYNHYVMKTEFVNGNIVLENVADFKLSHIFDCGQCFRFNPHPDGGYIGTAMGKTLWLTEETDRVVLHNITPEEYEDVWYNYLDLGRDYTEIKKCLSASQDPVIKTAISYGEGIRILKQDLWETTISFIISASNNIPRIKKIIDTMCKSFGIPHSYMGNTYYSFPTPERIARLTPQELSCIKAGFREKYILECARRVASGEYSLYLLHTLDTKSAKDLLMTLNGIGNKVSDCILLFSLGRFDSFPIDVWIKRIMEYCYFNNTPQKPDTIISLAEKMFGDMGGIAQQYLFYYARELKIGTK